MHEAAEECIAKINNEPLDTSQLSNSLGDVTNEDPIRSTQLNLSDFKVTFGTSNIWSHSFRQWETDW